MELTGIITAFIAAVCWAASVFPFTKAGRAMTVESLNIIRLVLGTILVLIVAIIVSPDFTNVFSENYISGWLWLGGSGILALGIGDYFGLRMYAILSPRFGSVLTTFSPAMALFAGIILLGEDINITGITGMLITITGVLTISLGRKERSGIPDHGHGSVTKGIIFGVISAACNGCALALSKKGFLVQAATNNSIHPVTGSFIRFLIATIVVLTVLLIFKRVVVNFRNIIMQPPAILKTAVFGVLLGPVLAVSLGLTSIQYIDVAVAQTIFALVPVIALVISYFIYKEAITRNALGGVLLAITGVSVLIWRIPIQQWIANG